MMRQRVFLNHTHHFSAIRNMVISLASRKQNLSVVIQAKIIGGWSIFQLEYEIYVSKF